MSPITSPPAGTHTYPHTPPRSHSLKYKVGSGLRRLVARGRSSTAPPAIVNEQKEPIKSREYEDVNDEKAKVPGNAHRRADTEESMGPRPRALQDDNCPPDPPFAHLLTRSCGSSSPVPDVPEPDEDDGENLSHKVYVAGADPTPMRPSLLEADKGATSWCESDPIMSKAGGDPAYTRPGAQAHSLPVEPIVPPVLVHGTPLLKITPKKASIAIIVDYLGLRRLELYATRHLLCPMTHQKVFRLDADQGFVTWENKKGGIVQIENIKEIRTGLDARYYREQFKVSAEQEDRWMTIVYTSNNKYKTIHTIAFSEETIQLWSATLNALRGLRMNIMSGSVSPSRLWERHYWRGAVMSVDGRMGIEEFERLCMRLGMGTGRDEVVERFNSADKGSKGSLGFSDFQTFVKILHARPDIKRLWNRMRGEGLFDIVVFGKFMREEQMMDMTDVGLARIFEKYATGGTGTHNIPPDSYVYESPAPSSKVRSRLRPRSGSLSFLSTKIENARSASPMVCSYPDKEPVLSMPHSLTTLHFTLDDFSAFLLGADNSAFEDEEHDMSRPLSEYFISSSHNTYLVGHQLVGESTIEGYIRSLADGCRNVEVDIWDGDHEPVVTHGRTLTGSVPLRHVAQAIANAEIHTGIEQQSMIAQIFKDKFGSALISSRLDGTTNLEELECLPSPEELRGRVLLRFKDAFSGGGVSASTGSGNKAPKRVSSGFSLSRYPEPAHLSPPAPPTPVNTSDPLSASTPTSSRKKQRDGSNGPELGRPKLKMSRSLTDLLVYTVGVKFHGLNNTENYTVEQMFSLSEKMANKILKENKMGLVNHCRTNLVRVYPNGTRVSSTNYEPARYWASGVQLLAMNGQTTDWGNMMNQSMFLRNGRRGYVLKPEALRVKVTDLLTKRVDYILEITIISAQQIPRKRDKNGHEIIKDGLVSSLVEVSLHTPDYPDERIRTYRTSTVPNNGFNPVWEEAVSIPFTCSADMWDLIFLKLAELCGKDTATSGYMTSNSRNICSPHYLYTYPFVEPLRKPVLE